MPVKDGLSIREAEVLKLIALGKRNQDIAAYLNISINTVEFHLKNIYSKLLVTNRTEACQLYWAKSTETTDSRSDTQSDKE